MPRHSVLEERLNAALAPAPFYRFTSRDARLPALPGVNGGQEPPDSGVEVWRDNQRESARQSR